MIRFTLTVLSLIISALPTTVMADTTDVWCFTQQRGYGPTSLKQCGFSERQGNVNVYREGITYVFVDAQQGISFDRINDLGGILFQSPHGLLRVFWDRPCSEWSGCAGDSWFLVVPSIKNHHVWLVEAPFMSPHLYLSHSCEEIIRRSFWRLYINNLDPSEFSRGLIRWDFQPYNIF